MKVEFQQFAVSRKTFQSNQPTFKASALSEQTSHSLFSMIQLSYELFLLCCPWEFF